LTPAPVLRARLGLAAVCLVAVILGSPGLTSESSVTLHGDMPKYLMNGVYMLDVLHDRPFDSVNTFVDYTRLYFARYPALTLGHHPPLLSAAEVPMFAVFGVSVVSARFIVLSAFVGAVALLYALMNELYGPTAALLAGIFVATSPQTVLLGRSVLSEMPALALALASAYCLRRFCATERRLALVGFVVTASLSLYAKQLAVFVFPAYLAAAVASLGYRRLLRRDIVLAAATIALVSMPLVPMTLMLSSSNVEWTLTSAQNAYRNPLGIVWKALSPQLTMPILLLSAAGMGRVMIHRDLRSVLFVVWVLVVLGGVAVVGRIEPGRYGVFAVPALCALAAATVAGFRGRRTAAAAVGVCLLAGGHQAVAATRVSVEGAGGYEEAARFVLSSDPGPTVIFSGDIDTGFFTFFVRKHDLDRRLVVLRADKLFTTSRMADVAYQDRIETPDEIYEALRRLGTRYVVIEDRPSRSAVLRWLQEELRSAKFAERWRMPIETTDPRLRGTSLAVYEYLEAGAPDPDAELSMDLPIVGRSLSVPLSDLVQRKYLR